MNQKITCKTGLKKNIINKTVFEREIKLCQKFYQNKESCGWGKCKDCGVIFLLYKLHKGELVDKKEQIKKLRNNIFNSKSNV